jgi:hypothetical protein
MSHARLLAVASSATLILVLALSAGAQAKTTWLCKPGLAKNPCAVATATTHLSVSGEPGHVTVEPYPRHPKIDCFYVYPTVSDQQTPQATRKIDPEERSIALYQAARYSSDCRVFAPMYRQVTLRGLLQPATVTTKMRTQGYQDVVDAWRDYLKHDNKGRGVVLIGHSQGSFVLRQLIAKEIDKNAKVRKRLVSAILLGGNVLVKKGSDKGGDFKNVKACRSSTQLGCVIAFSTFNATPPANAVFGVAGTGRSVVPGESAAGKEVLCTNPAALGGGSATLTSVYPSAPFAPGTTLGGLTAQVGLPTTNVTAPWIRAQAYTGQCSGEGGANVLRIAGKPGAPVLNALPDATWGLHLVDANIALGDLIRVVGRESAQYLKH